MPSGRIQVESGFKRIEVDVNLGMSCPIELLLNLHVLERIGLRQVKMSQDRIYIGPLTITNHRTQGINEKTCSKLLIKTLVACPSRLVCPAELPNAIVAQQ